MRLVLVIVLYSMCWFLVYKLYVAPPAHLLGMQALTRQMLVNHLFKNIYWNVYALGKRSLTNCFEYVP